MGENSMHIIEATEAWKLTNIHDNNNKTNHKRKGKT